VKHGDKCTTDRVRGEHRYRRFVSVDSTTVRAHQRAAGAAVSEQEIQAALDWLRFIPVLAKIRVPRRRRGGSDRSRPDAVAADMAYGYRANRDYLRKHGIKR